MTDLLDSQTAARLLGVSIRTAHRMAADGRLPSTRMLGNSLVFDRAEVEAYAADRVPAVSHG